VNTGPGAVFMTLHFLCNIQMCKLSETVALHSAGKTYQGHTFSFIGPIHKLRRKEIVVNMATELETNIRLGLAVFDTQAYSAVDTIRLI
jgi:hypothetical protein